MTSAEQHSEKSAASHPIAGWIQLLGLIAAIPLLMINIGLAGAATQPSVGYSRLIDWMTAEISENPLMALGGPETGFSNDAHRTNLEYFQNHPDLIHTIKAQLESTDLSWELIESKQRLLAVPERRAAYADIFEAYCRDVIDFVIATTGGQNPYNTIVTLAEDITLDLSTESGITVLLVHNLAEEYAYTYAFRGAGQKTIAIELNQKMFTGELGSYTSTLVSLDDGSIDFVPSRMTVWQNAASNPYSVLMVPVEETLHILLRSATEQAICSELAEDNGESPDINGIIEEWVAVEEAVAGGLVNQLLPDFLEQRLTGFKTSWIEDDLIEKKKMNRYRYLRSGIQAVTQLGVAETLDLYQYNPHKFRTLLQPIVH